MIKIKKIKSRLKLLLNRTRKKKTLNPLNCNSSKGNWLIIWARPWMKEKIDKGIKHAKLKLVGIDLQRLYSLTKAIIKPSISGVWAWSYQSLCIALNNILNSQISIKKTDFYSMEITATQYLLELMKKSLSAQMTN
jgi:hypothetical protein